MQAKPAWHKGRHAVNVSCQYELSRFLMSYLSSLGKCWPMVSATDAQHILSTVEEFREAVELTVVEVDWRLVNAIQRGLARVGAGQQGAQHCPTSGPVSLSSEVKDLAVPLHHICESHRQAGVQKGIVRTQACLLAQQSVTTTKTDRM